MTQRLSKDQLLDRLSSLKVLSLDVDGVLTDGGLYYADDGSQMRKFNVKDGMGMKRAGQAGVEVCIITASKTPSIHHRGEALGLKYVFVGREDKLTALQSVCDDLGVTMDQVAHVGDDLNDIPVLKAVGLALTVNDAIEEVLAIADYVTSKNGGDGAVRELTDLIVKAKGIAVTDTSQ